MSTLTDFLTFEYANAYDLSTKKDYSEPKIYDARGDLSKRWYVYFSYRNPKTGKLKRQSPIYGGANRYKTKTERMELLMAYRRSLSDFLKRGFNPYQDNTHLLTEQDTIESRSATDEVVADNKSMSYQEAFDYALGLKRPMVKESTYVNYANRCKQFANWLKNKNPKINSIGEVTRKVAMDFLNDRLKSTSARTRNNLRTDLGSIFQTLEDNEIIASNFFQKIPVLNSRPERNKTYTLAQQEKIYEYLREKDQLLLLYIQFISYNFLRPIEVCRLRVGDINIEEKRLYVRAKNSPVKTKIIPDIMVELLPQLEGLQKDSLLFTPDGLGGDWDAKESNRRNYFSARFRKVVKQPFGLGKEYGLYSFRHTFITRLYNEMIKTGTPHEVKSRLMLITGHSTMSALEKYLRNIDAALPGDYSDLLK
ncbi:tyrosine-type recombinase/integrase [Flavobacteriaceae bacterium TK19130]|nr:tyrosine-type recombinase/integrase [Thermobacterium salinum]